MSARSASRPTNLSVDWSAERVAALVRSTSHEVAVVGAPEGDPPVGGERLVAVVAVGEHHVDDRARAPGRAGPRGRASASARCSSGIWCGAASAGRRWSCGASARPGCRPGRRAGCPVSCAAILLVRSAAALRSSPLPRLSKEAVPLRTFTPKSRRHHARSWHVIDAEGAILGRMSTEIATLLRGKHKPIWAPHVDTGDHVIVVNASKLAIDPQEGDRQAVPPPHRLPGRYPHREPRAPAGPQPRAGRAPRGAAHAAEGPARSPDAEEAQDLRRPDAPAPGAAARRPRAARRARVRARPRDRSPKDGTCPSP